MRIGIGSTHALTRATDYKMEPFNYRQVAWLSIIIKEEGKRTKDRIKHNIISSVNSQTFNLHICHCCVASKSNISTNAGILCVSSGLLA